MNEDPSKIWKASMAIIAIMVAMQIASGLALKRIEDRVHALEVLVGLTEEQ